MMGWVIPCAVGFGTGIPSAFGIGGGTLLLLAMTLFLGVDSDTARCINLLYFLPTALGSLYYHKKNGYLDKTAIRTAAPVGALLAVVGAVAAAYLDTGLLRKAFGLYLLWAGVSVLWPRRKTGKNAGKSPPPG